jgi:hypothetical protein
MQTPATQGKHGVNEPAEMARAIHSHHFSISPSQLLFDMLKQLSKPSTFQNNQPTNKAVPIQCTLGQTYVGSTLQYMQPSLVWAQKEDSSSLSNPCNQFI